MAAWNGWAKAALAQPPPSGSIGSPRPSNDAILDVDSRDHGSAAGPLWCAVPSVAAAEALPARGVDDPLATSPASPHMVVSAGPDAANRSDITTDFGDDAPLDTARRLVTEGRYQEALALLDVTALRAPLLVDRIELLRGEALLAAGRPDAAATAFARAMTSPEPAVAARARAERVRALLRMGHREGPTELARLLRVFPALPQARSLRLELAAAHERAGRRTTAAAMYRAIDLEAPGSVEAERARAELERLRTAGVRVAAWTDVERVERAERLLATGPMSMAREEIERLLAARLGPAERTRAAELGARLARIEGRWEQARQLTLLARRGRLVAPTPQDAEREAETLELAEARERQAALERIRAIAGRTPVRRLTTTQLARVIAIAAAAGLSTHVDEALEGLRAQRKPNAQLVFEAAIAASGTGSDAHLEALFGSLVEHPRLGVAARYHRARALERLGRLAEAEIEHLRVQTLDRSETRWYAALSAQRVRWVHEAMLCACDPEEAERLAAHEADGASTSAPDGVPPLLASRDAAAAVVPRRTPPWRAGTMPPERIGSPSTARPDLLALADRLASVAALHGTAYPWIARAEALLRLGEARAASDELHEVLVAWRAAIGRPLRATGLLAVWEGTRRPGPVGDWKLRAARKALDLEARRTLAEVAAALGDEGTAIGLEGPGRLAARPRPFERAVHEAARRHGLDPDLLYAVMRVESVFQHRVVSYAGAVGLMQIMPRTGALVAHNMGERGLGADGMLDPERNIAMGAWYLASLMRRFDGQLPLALAAYNGGPHNVRRWLRARPETMPLDAFLETIPFAQTHRYVRRVLAHYRAYRERRGLPPPVLSMTLPSLDVDRVAF
ncbi:MAG: lytic transglycosylase domain-containing protein [Myxococcales bacterium]|nr:lytic transglycosylase domain-containing protein [Myxococcales bacterium]